MTEKRGKRRGRKANNGPHLLKRIERRIDRALGYEFNTPRQRRRALWHFYWVDHAWIRSFWANLYEFAPGAWRSNQPSPARIKKYKEMGIKSVLNLRGDSRRSNYRFEKAACEREGLNLVNIRLKARAPVSRETLLDLLEIFETIEKPFLVHCKSGADRAGLASALYLMHIEGKSLAEAREMLSLRFAHVKRFQTGVLDYILDCYERDTKTNPMSIRDWIETCYRRKKITSEFALLRGQPDPYG